MRRSEKVEATLTPGEKETLQQLCDEVGCTEAELIRSVLISRSISLDDLETGKKTERVKNKTLQKQGRKHAPEKTDERGEAIAENAEKRDVSFHVMLTASEKKAIEQRAEALGISVSELVRRSAIYGKIESFNFDIAEVEKLHHELVTCSHPPCNFAARGGGFSLKATDVASIDELSPCAPRFRFL